MIIIIDLDIKILILYEQERKFIMIFNNHQNHTNIYYFCKFWENLGENIEKYQTLLLKRFMRGASDADENYDFFQINYYPNFFSVEISSC